MTDHPSDDFDERLRDAARDYNRPADVPRERMWAAIRAARASRATVPLPQRRTRRVWFVPAAAAAVLIIGIAIGRVSQNWTVAPGTSLDVSPKPDSRATSPGPIAVIDSSIKPESTERDSVPRHAQLATRDSQPDSRSTPDAQRSTHSQPFGGGSANMAYRLAVVEHLAGTEAMLTSFRAAAKHGEVDAQITTWARNLLTTTRLLQASAAEDPTMKRLLDDLELVLVQIAQYKSANPHRAEELELIEHSIERRGVIGKLHTNIPARVAPAGT